MDTFALIKPFRKIKYIEFNELAYVFWGVVLLLISSQLSIPVKPVPITLQSLGVMLIGLIYKRSLAMIVIGIYLGLGALGAPGYANYSGGYHFLFAPSGGYLWGFLAGVTVMTSVGTYLNYQRTTHILLNCILGTLTIHICGVGWLAYLFGFTKAIEVGVMPFIFPSMLKIIFTTICFSSYMKLMSPNCTASA